MKYGLILIMAGAIGLFAFFKYQGRSLSFEYDVAQLRIAEAVIEVELSRTLGERQLGLSGRQSLSSNGGMLFIFPKPGLHAIWMKGMKFPIDIIWLDENLRVVHMKEWAEPSSYPENFIPQDLATYVLETNAGFAARAGIKIGTQARILR